MATAFADYKAHIELFRESFLDCWIALSTLHQQPVATAPLPSPSQGFVLRTGDGSSVKTLSAAEVDMNNACQIGVSDYHDYQRRNTPNGDNVRFVCNQLLVAFYSDWEDRARKLIATELGYSNQNLLKHDIWGDLRHVRIAIVHKKGIASKEVANLKIFTPIPDGQQITWDLDRWKFTFDTVISWIESLSIPEEPLDSAVC